MLVNIYQCLPGCFWFLSRTLGNILMKRVLSSSWYRETCCTYIYMTCIDIFICLNIYDLHCLLLHPYQSNNQLVAVHRLHTEMPFLCSKAVKTLPGFQRVGASGVSIDFLRLGTLTWHLQGVSGWWFRFSASVSWELQGLLTIGFP